MTNSGLDPEDATKRRAIADRDPASDGAFVFAVTTTGVYCRPSCPSRRPRPEHVRFFDLPRQAEAAGFRPCRRCRPDQVSLRQRHAAAVETACRRLETAEEEPSLAALAAAAGLSPHHFHRVFKRATGITPKAYAQALRERRVAGALARPGARVTHAVHAAGYGSAARFYEGAGARSGMAPRAAAAGGEGETVRFAIADSWLGRVLVAATVRGVCAVHLGDDDDALEAELARRFPAARHERGDVDLGPLVAAVLARIERPATAEELPLDICGTAFEHRVWQALRAIPPGETRSYAEIAAAIGRPGAQRAVARACAANPVAVLTPCHRVVRRDGGLAGYRWGTARKARLLGREADGS